MKRILGFLALASLVFTVMAADSIKSLEPDNKATVSPKTFNQRLFSILPVGEVERLMADKIFMAQLDPTPAHSIPQGIKMRWKFEGDRGNIHYEMYLGQKNDLSDARKFEPPHSIFYVNNLIPGETYFWKVQAVAQDGTVTAESGVRQFTVEFLLPRVIALPNCWNVRDLGGRVGIDGRRAPFGKIFRSGGLNYNSEDGGKTPGKNTVTEEAIKEALEVLRIRTELDLRWDNEVAGMTVSPLGPTVQYIHIPTKLYGAMYTGEGMANYAELFRIFTKPENYPIDFHCIAGADRTGTLAFLLESTLGYSVEDIRRDYTYTTQYSPRNFSAIDGLIDGMKAFGAFDEPLRYKAERYLLRCGITPDEILAFQEFILGSGLSKSPALEKARVLEKVKAEFDKETDMKVIDNAPLVGMVMQCKRLHLMTLSTWQSSPVKFVGTDGNGRFLIHLNNSSNRENYAGFQSASLQGKYRLLDIDAKKFYGVFTAEELENTPFVMQAHTEHILVLEVAADDKAPEGYTAETLAKPTADILFAKRFTEAPVIDGKADDIWSGVSPMPLSDIGGVPFERDGGDVRIATNAAHDTLYFLVNVEDASPVGENAEHDNDLAWKGDDIEIFLSCAGNAEYFHYIIGRGGCTFDEKVQDKSWNWEGAKAVSTSSDASWTAEFSLPLGPLNLDGPVEVNVCVAGSPDASRKNLRATGGTFHMREAIIPVWLESAGEAEKR